MSFVRILLLLVGATILSACASVEHGPRGAVAVPIAAPAAIPAASPITPVAVKVEPVTFSVHFDFASADIRASAMQILYGAAQKAKRIRPGIVKIRGFTDASGKRDFNLKLAQSRAEIVATQLRKLGIEARIEIVAAEIIGAEAGKSKKDPANRRVEVSFEEFPVVTTAASAIEEPATSSLMGAPDMGTPAGLSSVSAYGGGENPTDDAHILRLLSADECSNCVEVPRQRSINLHLS